MNVHFLDSYVQLLIKTCHRRGIHAMGGMAAQIPIRNDPEANQKALEKVRQDKLREVKAGHDGTWVAHPGLVPVAKEIFDAGMPSANQINRKSDEVNVTAKDLLAVPGGDITEEGLRVNIDVGVQYLESWLRGVGCVPIYNLMEDAATAEISRSQVWQWIRHGAKLNDGRTVTADLVRRIIPEELEKARKQIGAERYGNSKFDLAAKLFEEMMTKPEFTEFLTLVAYEQID
jgi:malate synthase